MITYLLKKNYVSKLLLIACLFHLNSVALLASDQEPLAGTDAAAAGVADAVAAGVADAAAVVTVHENDACQRFFLPDPYELDPGEHNDDHSVYVRIRDAEADAESVKKLKISVLPIYKKNIADASKRIFGTLISRHLPPHPYICKVLSVAHHPGANNGFFNGDHICQMLHEDLPSGNSLFRILSEIRAGRMDPLTVPHIKFIFMQVLLGLDFVHSHGFAYKELSALDIQLNATCDAVLATPRIAKRYFPRMEESRFIWCKEVKAPETVLYLSHETSASNMFTIGCLLYECASNGERLFPEDNIWFLNRFTSMLRVLGQDELTPETLAAIGCHQAEHQAVILEMLHLQEHARPTLARSLARIEDPDLRDLISRLLKLDPRNRLNAREALSHPFFAELLEDSDRVELMQNHRRQQTLALLAPLRKTAAGVPSLKTECLCKILSTLPNEAAIDGLPITVECKRKLRAMYPYKDLPTEKMLEQIAPEAILADIVSADYRTP